MGQGLDKLSTGASDVRVYLNELPGYALKESIETKNSRFLKTVECVHQEGRVVVKVYARRGETVEMLLKEKARLDTIRGTFAMVKVRRASVHTDTHEDHDIVHTYTHTHTHIRTRG